MEQHVCHFNLAIRQRIRTGKTVYVANVSFRFFHFFSLIFSRIDPNDLLQSTPKAYGDYDTEEDLSEKLSSNPFFPTQLRYYRRFMKKEDKPKRVSKNENNY